MEKKLLKDEELREVTGGLVKFASVGGQDWIKCPHCGSEKPFVPVGGWWCCADCGKQVKKDLRGQIVI